MALFESRNEALKSLSFRQIDTFNRVDFYDALPVSHELVSGGE